MKEHPIDRHLREQFETRARLEREYQGLPAGDGLGDGEAVEVMQIGACSAGDVVAFASGTSATVQLEADEVSEELGIVGRTLIRWSGGKAQLVDSTHAVAVQRAGDGEAVELLPSRPEDIVAGFSDAQVAAVLEVLHARRHEPPSEDLARAVLEAALSA